MLLEIAVAISTIVALAPPQNPPAPAAAVTAPDCRRLLTAPVPGSNELCQAQDAMRAGEAAAEADPARGRQFSTAADQFTRAANLLRDPQLRLYALDALARVYGPSGLNEPARVEQVLREVAALSPGDSSPLRRIAKILEDQGNTDGAESTLLSARQQMPEDAEVYNELSGFYARRAAALKADAKSKLPAAGDQPDADGYYRISDSLRPPEPLIEVEPGYIVDPPASDDPDLVVMEVRIDELGQVSDAKVIKSVPAGDAAAMDAAKQWRFKPTMVDGRAVPMKMTVAVRVRRF